MPDVWEGWRREPRRRVGGRGALDQPRAHHGRQRHADAGDGGAGALPAPAPSAAAAADGLRDLAADLGGDRGVLPRPAARGHPQPRPQATPAGVGGRRIPALPQLEAAEPAPPAPPDPRADPRPEPEPPDPLQHHRPRARRRAQPRDPDVRRRPAAGALGSKTGCRRLFEEVGVPCPIGAEDLDSLDDLVHAVCGLRAESRTWARSSSRSTRACPGRATRWWTCAGSPRPGTTPRPRRSTARLRDMEPEATSSSVDDYLAGFARLGGIVEERITGDELTSPSVQMRVLPDRHGRAALDARPAARRGRAGRSTSAACSRPTLPTRARSPSRPW